MNANSSFYEREADNNRYFRVMQSFNNRTPAHFHNTTEIIWVNAGVERVVINGVERLLGPGDLGVSNSFDIHYYDYVGSSAVTVAMLSEEYTARFRERFGVRLGSFLLKNERTPTIESLFQILMQVQNGNDLIVSGYVDVLLGTLLDAYPTEPGKNGDGGKVVEILRYIDDNFSAKLSLKSVSSRFGYSETYFSALFNRFVGMHFKDYLNRLRITRAAALAEAGDRKVSDIALSCGFESLNTYYRALKKWGESGKFQ